VNDKQQLAAMGDHMAEQAGQAQPLCMAKRIEELEEQVRVMAGLLREAVPQLEDYDNFETPELLDKIDAALAGKLPEPAAPEGWRLVPVELTEEMTDLALALDSGLTSHGLDLIYRAMLAAAPKPEGK
jgi:hypothetical protein